MATQLPPPPRKADERFDNWVFTLWKRAVAALVSGGVGATAPITITTSGTGTVNIGHSTSGVATGTYGSQSQVPIVVVDTYGHITLATSSAVAISGTNITGTDLVVSSPLVGTATNALLRSGTIGHGTSGAIPATYGNQSTVPIITVNTYGHITTATSSAILLSGTAIAGANLTVSSPLVGTATNALLRAGTVGHGTSGVIGGTYGGALGVPRVVVDTWGHVTAGTSLPLQATAPILVGSNAGTFTWGHSTSGIVTGTYGAASVIPQVVVNTWGHITAINTLNVAVNGTAVTGADLTVNSPLLGTVTNALLRAGAISHATSGIVPGTFGGAASIPQVVVNTYGHVTAVNTFGLTGTAVSGANLTISAPLVGTATNALLRAGTVAHGTSGVASGTYGGTAGLPRVTIDTYGHVTAAASFPLQATAPILIGSNAGTFTWGHSTSGVASGTYGGAASLVQLVVNTYGHVTSVSTFAAANSDYPMVKGSVPDGSSVTISDGYQLLCVGMTVFGTGTIIVEGTGILAVL